MLTDYLNLLFDEFVELHGDKFFGDDRALRTGFAKLDRYKVLVVGHYKGKTLKERNECFFGCAHPEGYRKAMAKMRLAAKYRLPIICLIDTPGAYPGIGAEERGQAQVIAESMLEMSRLPTPIICVVIGEGGSGGALGIGVGDRVAVLQFAYYSVISPEGCAGILWKSHDFAADAARALKLTSKYLQELGCVDDVIEEPLGAAHRDHHQMATRLKMYLAQIAPRAGRHADRQAARRPLRQVPPHGPVPRRRRRRPRPHQRQGLIKPRRAPPEGWSVAKSVATQPSMQKLLILVAIIIGHIFTYIDSRPEGSTPGCWPYRLQSFARSWHICSHADPGSGQSRSALGFRSTISSTTATSDQFSRWRSQRPALPERWLRNSFAPAG